MQNRERRESWEREKKRGEWTKEKERRNRKRKKKQKGKETLNCERPEMNEKNLRKTETISAAANPNTARTCRERKLRS